MTPTTKEIKWKGHAKGQQYLNKGEVLELIDSILEGIVPMEMTRSIWIRKFDDGIAPHEKSVGWNACRESILQRIKELNK